MIPTKVKNSVFSGRFSFIRNRLKRINYVVDDISKEEGKLSISGWVVEPDETRIGIYRIEGKRAIQTRLAG
jgi:hypothetical protein